LKGGVAIIGHGPSMRGAGYGKYIDDYRIVIRFPYLKDWQIPIDYGKRTTYWFSNINRLNKRIRRELPEEGYYLWAKNGNPIGDEYKFLISKFGGQEITEQVKFWQGRYLKDAAHPYFSHGGVAIIAAISFFNLPVTAFGCDSIRDSLKETKYYVGSAIWENRQFKDSSHDYQAEHKITTEFATKNKVELRFI